MSLCGSLTLDALLLNDDTHHVSITPSTVLLPSLLGMHALPPHITLLPFLGNVLLEHAERKSDAVIIPVSGKGVRPTVSVTQKVVRFGSCSCYERRDVVVGIKNTSELPVR